MKQVSAGQRRHMVTLENPGTPVADPDLGYTQTYTQLQPGQVWAEIKPANARDLERVTTGTSMSTATHLVTIPYHSGVTTQTRLTFGTRIFQVNGVVNPEERNIELILTCEEIVT
jgi:SPP1 family predicted phage head-tail adaptor